VLNVTGIQGEQFDNYVCYVHAPNDLEMDLSRSGIPVFGLDAAGKRWWPAAIVRLCKLIRSLRIDLIHTSLFSSDILGGIAGRLCGVPVVGTICNTADIAERLLDNPRVNKFKLTVSNSAWGLAIRSLHQKSIAVSYAVKDSAIRNYGITENRITVIYRSVAEPWNSPGMMGDIKALRKDLGIDGAYPVLLNVGRLVPQKGQRYLIQAMPSVIERFPQARLLIAGDGPLKESTASLCRELGVSQHVTLLGQRNDIRSLLELSDIFVFPSLYEGLGGALMEATSAGRPCVASRVGPLPEVLDEGNSGLLVLSQSPEELAQAINYLGENRGAAQAMGQRGKQGSAEKFNVNKNVRRLEEVYQEVLCRDEASALSASLSSQPKD
jgi:glycosyltransferase involved in cell wall biosynthesis